MAWSLADMFGLDEKQVHVTAPFVGGAFGSKTLWQHHVLAAAASRLARRPVRMALSREGVYRVVGRAHAHRAAGAHRRRGRWALPRADPHRHRGA